MAAETESGETLRDYGDDADDVRDTDIRRIYRESPMFRDLRDVKRLKGKCGRWEFRHLCGGSRARAYAVTGDYLESDPLCAYHPR